MDLGYGGTFDIACTKCKTDMSHALLRAAPGRREGTIGTSFSAYLGMTLWLYHTGAFHLWLLLSLFRRFLFYLDPLLALGGLERVNSQQ